MHGATVHSNDLADRLYGGARLDWYFAGLADLLFNRNNEEVVAHI